MCRPNLPKLVRTGVHRRHPFSVWTAFFHSPEGAPQSNAWISAEDCPRGQANRWQCAFLPSTNCTTPAAITSCDPRFGDCNAYSNTWLSALLTSADEGGQFESPLHERIMQHGQQPTDHTQQVNTHRIVSYQIVSYRIVSYLLKVTDGCGGRLWHSSQTCLPSAPAAACQTALQTTTSS